MECGAAVCLVEKHPVGRADAKLLGGVDQEMQKREVKGHLRNLYNKAIDALYVEFSSSVEQHLENPEHQALVQSCHTFTAFNNLLKILKPLKGVHDSIVAASGAFRDHYDLVEGFWEPYDAVDRISMQADTTQDYSVAESAAFLGAVCDNFEAFPELDPVWAMVEALVNYGKEHAERLDDMADTMRQANQRMRAALRQEQSDVQQV